ncbi:MAG: hypothetical protein CMO05_00735 [Thalassospira sp.]|nr:hypothetical protein [Thalassospira sp.]
MASPANQDDGVGLTDTDIEQVLDDRAEDNSSAGNSDSGASAQGEGNTPSSANQVFTNVQNVIGTAYDDVLVGDSQDNTLVGGDGNDILEPGEGEDEVTGGAGRDTFVLESGFAKTTITDFSIDEDELALTDLGVNNANDLMSLAVDDGAGNTVITFATGDVLVLQGVSKADLANVSLVAAPQISDVSVSSGSTNEDGGATGAADEDTNVIDGTAGDDTIAGTSGDDVISSGGGADTVVGGDGEDTLSLDRAADGMDADIAQGRATDV